MLLELKLRKVIEAAIDQRIQAAFDEYGKHVISGGTGKFILSFPPQQRSGTATPKCDPRCPEAVGKWVALLSRAYGPPIDSEILRFTSSTL
jgi:hypothetical protein